MTESKKILLWFGNGANQVALANKIASRFPVSGIVVDRKLTMRKPPFSKRLLAALRDRIFFRTISSAWSSLQHEYHTQFPGWPTAPLLAVDSINSDEAFEFSTRMKPDLVVVSGTGMVKARMLSIQPSIGIINLHTGLSPYIKGGPNCTNWCIATRQFDKIGNTIMWINEGIDAGNLITTEKTPVTGSASLLDVQRQVMEHAHDLYLRAISYLLNSKPPYQSVPQKQLAEGRLYMTKQWDFTARKALLRNLPAFLKGERGDTSENIITIPLSNQD
jgi:hypothetical protein